MKEFFKTTLKVIAWGVLNLGVESSKFTIKCSKCEGLVELENGFLNSNEDIVVNVDENIYDTDEKYIVSIRCRKCGSDISSEF
ncbi:hypothetical protein QUF81_00150 [Peribacillus simplex]|uniref:hypothetical protein n=1 Tax=Peribacillus simplex TaxID=1478 RepID=UPI0025A22F58|nr:hypothetical protein [Peribacillus simplex]MDM5291714.1 hypothetical protein [Peribacillus simplex]